MNLVLRQDDDIWVKDGWFKRFGMDPDDYGREDTAEKMRAMPKTDINEMMDYYRQARAVTLAHLDEMPVEDLDKEFLPPAQEDRGKRRLGLRAHPSRRGSAPRTDRVPARNDARVGRIVGTIHATFRASHR